ncbi:MAG: hypothetical protein ACRDCA_00100, partial [Serratia sp. (in: enterobacteria)]|uniref:hypothetical protein n=1 Tax=Serratia sp. (in: enterobacteria) TaxID=616 RepID=UPI003F3367F4
TRSKDMVRQPKQPQAEEPEIAPEPTPEPEKPRVKSTDLVRNKLEERKEKFEDMSAKERQDMLKTDPEQYRQMERAREDLEKTNTLIDSLASKHKMSEEAVADYINEMGGVDGVRKEMRDKNIKGNEHQYIDRRIREMEDLKIKEAKSKVSNLRDTAAKAVGEDTGVKVDPEFEASVIADKHMQVRDELSSLGFEDDIINQALKNAKATDTTSDFDPKIVKNWAKTLQKKQVDEAKASMAEANEKAKEAVQRASEHAKKPMPEGERVAAERQLKEQISAHEGVLKKKGVSATDRAKSQAQLDKLNRALTQLSERETKLAQAKRDADAEAKEATKEMERTRREYEQLWKKAEKRMDDIQKSVADGEKLAKQEKDMTEALVAMGAPESTAQRILHNMFISREKPLSDAEFSKLRARAVQDLEKAKEAETKVAKEAVKEDVAKMSDSELEAAAKEVLAVRREVKDLSATEQQAVTQAIIDELNARGQEGEATYMKAFNQIVARAEERKKQFPNNKKLWISADDKQLLQELMNKGEGKSWMGNLQKQLASRFFGDAESGSKYIRLSEEEIEKRVKMGLVDDDLVDAPRASWKKIGRKVNKSDK